MKYCDLKLECSNRVNDVPMKFAFNDEQFERGARELGVVDKSELVSIGMGGFMKKTDTHLFEKAMDANEKEIQEFLSADEGLMDALIYELGNYEYCITYDPTDALGVLDVSLDDARVFEIFQKAKKIYLDSVE